MNFLHRLIRTLILPNNAGPNDPAIIIGPDMPPCMQPTYSSAFFFRPPATVGAGIAGRPYMYMAQLIAPGGGTNRVDFGWLVYDPSGAVCGFIAFLQFTASNGGTGALTMGVNFQNIRSGIPAGVSTAINVIGNSTTPFGVAIGEALRAPSQSPFLVDGRSMGRGIVDMVTSAASTAATAAEIVALTGNAITWYDGRLFEVKLVGQVLGSIANEAAFMSLRRTNLAGAVLWVTGVDATFNTVADHYEVSTLVKNTSGADITDNVVSTIQRAAGAGNVTDFANAGQPRYMKVTDLGATVDFAAGVLANIPQL